MKCTARIAKTFKKAKADSVWPLYCPHGDEWIENPHANGLEVCDGDVTVAAELSWDPYYGGSDACIALVETCSRCKYPFYDDKLFVWSVVDSVDVDITKLLERHLGNA